ncbi:N-acetyltransferase [Glutamicibacter mishrai]|uniref:GNAT family N-acetyltransferase n=1 Tax=Glutamicibacter mishrai TaxID=1775880 RepID=UPI0020CEFE3E|nr:GNAT family N-acetyltransferase [Glutamicibacter mishrai]UTT39702.1 N-acetyltransferase [Glutamicibacter mishrai]
MSEIKPVFLPERRRFALDDDGKIIGAAHYRDFDAPGGVERIFFHTTVDEEYGGQGLAGILVKFALENTIASGAKIVAVCPYVKSYVAKHNDYDQHLVAPTKTHLDLLPRS